MTLESAVAAAKVKAYLLKDVDKDNDITWAWSPVVRWYTCVRMAPPLLFQAPARRGRWRENRWWHPGSQASLRLSPIRPSADAEPAGCLRGWQTLPTGIPRSHCIRVQFAQRGSRAGRLVALPLSRAGLSVSHDVIASPGLIHERDPVRCWAQRQHALACAESDRSAVDG